jgi:hypothetical protein
LPSADPFPVDALGDVLAPAARAIHNRAQAPLAIAAATLAVQAHADVTLPIGGGRTRPISNYFASVAATGERKSECDQQSGWPIRKHEKALRDKYDVDLPAYINDKAGWDKARDTAMKRGKGDRAAIKAALNALGPEPSPPLVPMLTCPEPTFEGLCKLFFAGRPSLGLFSAEGGQFIGGHGMSEENKLKTAAGLSCAWDGEPLQRRSTVRAQEPRRYPSRRPRPRAGCQCH